MTEKELIKISEDDIKIEGHIGTATFWHELILRKSWTTSSKIKSTELAEQLRCQIMDGQKALIDVKKYGFLNVEDIVSTLSSERQKIIVLEQQNKTLKEFLCRRINELDRRISSWSNFTHVGNTVYSLLSLKLETYKEILSIISGEST